MTTQIIKRGKPFTVPLAAQSITPWFILKGQFNPMLASLSLSKASSAVLTAHVEYTNSPDPDTAPVETIRTVPFFDDNDVKQTEIDDVSGIDYLDTPIMTATHAVRLRVTAWTSGTATLNIFQPGSV